MSKFQNVSFAIVANTYVAAAWASNDALWMNTMLAEGASIGEAVFAFVALFVIYIIPVTVYSAASLILGRRGPMISVIALIVLAIMYPYASVV